MRGKKRGMMWRGYAEIRSGRRARGQAVWDARLAAAEHVRCEYCGRALILLDEFPHSLKGYHQCDQGILKAVIDGLVALVPGGAPVEIKKGARVNWERPGMIARISDLVFRKSPLFERFEQLWGMEVWDGMD